jgi:putative ABC transport system permease protein
MKFLPLLWSGIWRKPVRTALIFLQVAVGFALFGVLQGMKTGMDRAVANARADVLSVGPSIQGGAPLPAAYMSRLQGIPGVKTVTFVDGLLGTYQKPDQPVYVLALAPGKQWLWLAPEILKVAPKDLEALQTTRTGVLISPDIAAKYGWHVGDRISLTSSIQQRDGTGTWTYDIVGTFTAHELGAGGYIVGNYSYLEEARALNKGTVRNFLVVISDPRKAAAMSDTIDRMFANSSNATQSQSFREGQQQQLQSLGDLNFAVRAIISAVLVALVFSTATMMMQNIRERTPELAVLKTLGFRDRTMFALVAAESILICIAGALAGLGLAWFAFPFAAKFMPGLSMPVEVVEIGIVGAVFVALVSVSVPGVRAARLNIIDALAGR